MVTRRGRARRSLRRRSAPACAGRRSAKKDRASLAGDWGDTDQRVEEVPNDASVRRCGFGCARVGSVNFVLIGPFNGEEIQALFASLPKVTV
jgi:hypothetical protein